MEKSESHHSNKHTELKKDDHAKAHKTEASHPKPHMKKEIGEEKIEKISFNLDSKAVITILSILIVLVLAFNMFISSTTRTKLNDQIEIAVEEARPAEIQLTLIQDSRCPECFDISSIVSSLKGRSNLNITEEQILDFKSQEASAMIAKYNIDKVPTIIATGEMEKAALTTLDARQDAAVFTNVNPPYTDKEGNILGLVTSTQLIDEDCENCAGTSGIIAQLKNAGVVFAEEKILSSSSAEGKALLLKHDILTVPSLILSPDISAYPKILQGLSPIGSIEEDGSYVLRTISPPYKNLSSGTVVGLVKITRINDEQCEGCFDGVSFKTLLTRNFGMFFIEDIEVDASDSIGQELIKKYNIKRVPTIVLSPEAVDYPTIVQQWTQVGTIEDDGSLVLREMQLTGFAYRDLETGQRIEPQRRQ